MTLTALLLPLVSFHLDPPWPREYNEVHPGLILEIDNDWLVGAYRNSHWDNSLVALRRFSLVGNPATLEVGVVAGFCTGYRSPLCGSLGLRFFERVEVNFMPRLFKYNAHTISLTWRQPL
jgi:hypothetical protein